MKRVLVRLLCSALVAILCFCSGCTLIREETGENAADAKLLHALRLNNLEACREAISDGAHIETLGGQLGETVDNRKKENIPLNIAVFLHREELSMCLLEAGADANVMSVNGVPALSEALADGQLLLCEALIAHGADLHQAAADGTLPVEYCFRVSASKTNAVALMRQEYALLMDHGLELTEESVERSIERLTEITAYDLIVTLAQDFNGNVDPVLHAIIDRDAAGVFDLLEEAETKHLFYAAAFGTPEILTQFFHNGYAADMLDAKNKNLLQIAAESGNLENVEYLMQFYDLTGRQGYAALLGAVLFDRTEAALMLMDSGVPSRSQDEGARADMLAYAAYNGNITLLECLLPEYPEADWPEAVVGAVEGNQAEALKLLLEAGADPNQYSPSDISRIPLRDAARLGHMECAEILLSYGADIEATSTGSAALAHACSARNVKMVELLIAQGADVNANSTETADYAPLVHAVYSGSLECVELLLKNGAIVTDEIYELIDQSQSNRIVSLIDDARGTEHLSIEVFRIHSNIQKGKQ